jgi:hypothetical protein
MFDEDGRGDCGADGGGAGDEDGAATHVGRECYAWQDIDAKMRRLAARRAALDVEEARMLMLAKRTEIHRHLGYGSFAEYVERVLGYAPNTGRDRVRVAEEIETLPALAEAWRRGALTYSVVREITRIATPDNEEALVAYVDGLTVREVEQAMRGRKKGDDPNRRPDPDLEPRIVRMELPPAAYALFRDARRYAERATGQMMSDAEFMAVACRAVLSGIAALASGGVEDGEPDDADAATEADAAAAASRDARSSLGTRNVPPHQIAIVVCADCKRGWQDTPSRSVELPPAALARMRCDAVELGRVDGNGAAIEPATRTIPAPTRRAVLARDRHRCQVPGCTMSRWVDVHHILHWEHGGTHDPHNLVTLCELHHSLHHDGVIRIAGEPGALVVTHADGRAYGTPPRGAAH